MNHQPNFLMHAVRGAALAAAALLATAAGADDGGLYGPVAPPDSAFIRVFNATPASVEDVHVGTEDLNDIAGYEASDFAFMPAGTYPLKVGTVNQPVTLQKNRFYTAVYQDGKVKVLENDRFTNHMKALIVVYNLLDGTELSLKTADGKTPVVDKVAPNTLSTREVNPVRTQLALYKGDQRLAPVKQVSLERGKAFSLFVTGTPEMPVPTWVVN